MFCPQIKHALGGEAVALREECNDGMTVHQRRRYRDGHGVDVNLRLDRHHVGPVMRRDFQNGFDGVDGPFFESPGSAARRIMVHSTVNEPQCSKSGTKVRDSPVVLQDTTRPESVEVLRMVRR